MGLDYLDTLLELKTVDFGRREITGYAAVFGNVDRQGDIIAPGAFTKTLAAKAPADIGVFIAHQFDRTLPVGIPLAIEQDAKGLRTTARIFRTTAGDDLLATARELQAAGKSLGMSIGYRPVGREFVRVGRDGASARKLTEVDLFEFSYAAAQAIANEEALVTGTKAAGGQGGSAMPYRVEAHGDQFCVVKEADGKEMGCHPSRDKALAQMRALYAAEGGKMADDDEELRESKVVWSAAYVNSLPNSSFLFVEPGEDDEEGKRVPRTKRHFPYKDQEGKIDLPHLRDAIGRIRQSNAPGLNKDAVQARAQRLLAAEQGGQGDGKTIDAAPEWQEGAALAIVGVGYRLLDAADAIAADQKAMRHLGMDVKKGQRIGQEMRAKLKDLHTALGDILQWAEYVDREQDGVAKIARYRRQLDLLEV